MVGGMDWRVFFSTFVTIFLAELGDKTQFAAVAAGGQAKGLKEVWLAVVLALALAGTLGVFAGRTLAHLFNPQVMRWISGGLLIFAGLWVLWARD